MGEVSKRIRFGIDVAGALAVVFIAVLMGWRAIQGAPPTVPPETKPVSSVPTELITLDDAFSIGNPSAPVTIVEYGDMECPACLAFANDTFKALVAKHVDTGQVRFMFKHYPLTKHAMAKPAAVAAQCAGQQGQFWPFYESVYAPGSKLSQDSLRSVAKSLKLNLPQWQDCQKATVTAVVVESQVDEARKLRLRATPAFLVGRSLNGAQLKASSALYGARDLATFDDAISKAMKDLSEPKR
jgi:protein-disulfide isomerase